MGKRKAKRQSRRNSLGGKKESNRQKAIRRKSNLLNLVRSEFLLLSGVRNSYALLPGQPQI